MIFEPLSGVDGAMLLREDRREDERGWFARTWCSGELAAHRLVPKVVQASRSWSRSRGTLRGLHFQCPPHAEAKVLSVLEGAIYDVIVDLRPSSSTFCRWTAVELTALDGRAVYVPEGCAHGFLTLEDDTLVEYQISAAFAPAAYRGVRWDDPAFGVRWPFPPIVIHPRDATYPDFVPEPVTP